MASSMEMESSSTLMEIVIKVCGIWESSKALEDFNTRVDPYTSVIGWITRSMEGDRSI